MPQQESQLNKQLQYLKFCKEKNKKENGDPGEAEVVQDH